MIDAFLLLYGQILVIIPCMPDTNELSHDDEMCAKYCPITRIRVKLLVGPVRNTLIVKRRIVIFLLLSQISTFVITVQEVAVELLLS